MAGQLPVPAVPGYPAGRMRPGTAGHATTYTQRRTWVAPALTCPRCARENPFAFPCGDGWTWLKCPRKGCMGRWLAVGRNGEFEQFECTANDMRHLRGQPLAAILRALGIA